MSGRTTHPYLIKKMMVENPDTLHRFSTSLLTYYLLIRIIGSRLLLVRSTYSARPVTLLRATQVTDRSHFKCDSSIRSILRTEIELILTHYYSIQAFMVTFTYVHLYPNTNDTVIKDERSVPYAARSLSQLSDLFNGSRR